MLRMAVFFPCAVCAPLAQDSIGAAGAPWWLRRSCHQTQLVPQIVCTNAPNWYRELIFADLCTFLCPRSSNMMMAKSIAVPIDDGAIFQVKSISEIIYRARHTARRA